MGVVVSDSSGGKKFTPAPAGPHLSVCVDVIDLGMVETSYKGQKKMQHKVRLVWQIDEKMESGDRFTVSQRYTASLSDKAILRRDLESWRGRPFTSEELKGFDLDHVLGVNAYLNVVHANKDGETYANVAAVMPPPKGSVKLIPENYTRYKDRKPEAEQPADDDTLSDAIDSSIPF